MKIPKWKSPFSTFHLTAHPQTFWDIKHPEFLAPCLNCTQVHAKMPVKACFWCDPTKWRLKKFPCKEAEFAKSGVLTLDTMIFRPMQVRQYQFAQSSLPTQPNSLGKLELCKLVLANLHWAKDPRPLTLSQSNTSSCPTVILCCTLMGWHRLLSTFQVLSDLCILKGNETFYHSMLSLHWYPTENKTHECHNLGVTTCVLSFFLCLHVLFECLHVLTLSFMP